MEHHRNFPDSFRKFLLRDILHYSEEDIKNLSLVDYKFALYYALETYIRRDLLYIMSRVYGNKEEGRGKIPLVIDQSKIKQWVVEQYQKNEEFEK